MNSLPYVSKIHFRGNKAVTTEELRQIISTSEPTSFLGLGLFGSARKPFNDETFRKDLALIKKLYAYKGYFFTEIDTSIVRQNNGRKLKLNILIRENKPSRIDSLRYEGIGHISPEINTRYLGKKKLKINDVFTVERLIEERDRTLSFFKDYGFTFFNEDSIRIKVDTAGTHAGILFRLRLPQQNRYGPVHVVVHNPLKKDTSNFEKTFARDNIDGKIHGKQKISPVLITSAIRFRPGELTSLSHEQRTIENLGGTNVFSSIYINQDSVKAGDIYTTIHLEPAPKHQIEPKILVDNRYGALFFGGSLAYENKNLFGGAEQLRTSVEYGTQSGYSKSLLGNLSESQYDKIIPYEFRIKNSLVMPVLKQPGNFYSATAEYANTKQPILLASKSALLRGTYSNRLTSSSRLNFDFFEIEWIKQDSLRGFKQLFKTDLAPNIGIDPTDTARVDAAVDSLLETHINQTFRLRYNYNNRQKVLPEKTILNLDLLFEHAGILPWVVDKFIDKQSYAGFSGSDPQIFGTAYSQYVKLESGISLAKNLSPKSQVAGRLITGWMAPYGKAETTPEERRFYAGGSNSMRGWLFNTLGPANSTSRAAANFGADIKLEMNLEYRLKFFKLFDQPSGITIFSDTGNIWDRSGPYGLTLSSLKNNIAWDMGIGLRLGSPVGPFRLDFAWKLHDPADPHPWRISSWNPGDFTFNFGIGEAF